MIIIIIVSMIMIIILWLVLGIQSPHQRGAAHPLPSDSAHKSVARTHSSDHHSTHLIIIIVIMIVINVHFGTKLLLTFTTLVMLLSNCVWMTVSKCVIFFVDRRNIWIDQKQNKIARIFLHAVQSQITYVTVDTYNAKLLDLFHSIKVSAEINTCASSCLFGQLLVSYPSG